MFTTIGSWFTGVVPILLVISFKLHYKQSKPTAEFYFMYINLQN